MRRTFILRISVDWQIHGHDAGLLTVSVLKKSVHIATAHMKVSIQSSNIVNKENLKLTLWRVIVGVRDAGNKGCKFLFNVISVCQSPPEHEPRILVFYTPIKREEIT